jgi:hypothetical protein
MIEEEFENPSIFEEKKYYEWKTGALAGVVEVYSAEANEVIWFESGRNVSMEQLDIQLKRIDESDFNLKREVLPSIPMEFTSNIPLGNPVAPPIEANPIKLILDKQKKFDSINLSFPVVLKVPSKKVIDLLGMMFDEEEVQDEIIKSIISNSEATLVAEFKEFIKDCVQNLIKQEGEQEI